MKPAIIRARTAALAALMPLGVERWACARTAGLGVIFVLHRVLPAGEERYDGYPEHALRRLLRHMARNRAYHPVQVEAFLAPDPPPVPRGKRAVALVFDDGYRDQVDVVAPILAEFGVPATVFATTGFVDGELWMWWDRVEYAMRHTSRRSAPAGERVFDGLAWPPDAGARDQEAKRVVERLKLVPDARRLAFMAALEGMLEVNIPPTPPPEYAPTSWDEMRKQEATGLMRFGVHTHTHPVLARTDDATAFEEIRRGWERLREELASPCPVLAFPNGESGDFGPREIAMAAKAGLRGTLAMTPGLVSRGMGGADGVPLPRYHLPGELGSFRAIASGFEALRRGRVPKR
jgi:peptidoglycan/xylan/chitin deacetylase (PgdA/CDA1 family)